MSTSIWRQCKSKKRYRNIGEMYRSKKTCERNRGKKLDYYWCEICGGYHLTSVIATEGNGYVLKSV